MCQKYLIRLQLVDKRVLQILRLQLHTYFQTLQLNVDPTSAVENQDSNFLAPTMAESAGFAMRPFHSEHPETSQPPQGGRGFSFNSAAAQIILGFLVGVVTGLSLYYVYFWFKLACGRHG